MSLLNLSRSNEFDQQDRDQLLVQKIEQISVALDNLAALRQPPQRTYDLEGNETTDLVQFDAEQRAYDAEYAAMRDQILSNGGTDFSAGIAIAGHNPPTVDRDALTACLKVTLQIGHSIKWFNGIP
jgi:hypothetical protein